MLLNTEIHDAARFSLYSDLRQKRGQVAATLRGTASAFIWLRVRCISLFTVCGLNLHRLYREYIV
jgi:hypothetical protein